jgi:hypothetical protein
VKISHLIAAILLISSAQAQSYNDVFGLRLDNFGRPIAVHDWWHQGEMEWITVLYEDKDVMFFTADPRFDAGFNDYATRGRYVAWIWQWYKTSENCKAQLPGFDCDKIKYRMMELEVDTKTHTVNIADDEALEQYAPLWGGKHLQKSTGFFTPEPGSGLAWLLSKIAGILP